MGKLWLILFALLIPPLTSCVQVEVSLSGDNEDIVDVGQYRFDKEVVPTTALCQLAQPLASEKQNTGVWCWAASAQMVINYLQSVNGPTPVRVSQCDIASIALKDAASPPPPLDCCMAEDSFVPEESPLNPDAYRLKLDKADQTCRVRFWPLEALRKNGYSADEASPPVIWQGLTEQLCAKGTPYIFVVRFYDDNGNFEGAHSSVVGGGRVALNGDKYVEVSDHSEDDFFLMKWEAFERGVPGDFVHDVDYINIQQN